MSSLRFRYRSGEVTDWIRAGSLCASRNGVGTRTYGLALVSKDGCNPISTWNEIASVEVKNFHGGPTVPLVLVGSAVVFGVAIANLVSGPSKDDARLRDDAAREEDVARLRSTDREPPRHDLHMSEVAPDAHSLFTAGEARRSIALVGAALEGGACTSVSTPCTTSSAWGHVRLMRFLEFRLGARHLDGSGLADKLRVGASLGARFHGELLPNRRLAFEAGIEGTVGPATLAYVRWGVRWRFADKTWLGVYPLNFAHSSTPSGTHDAFPTSLELVQDF